MPESFVKHIVLGMAGHIDHGKTSIVKALTGIDTDRLKEEKERGMTTDLGFAFLGDEIAIIDVPGHERFVKTMVAGVNSVDIALLVIAADDGIMPQTREHLEILQLLNIPKGIIALNKVDVVQPEWQELVTMEIRELMKGTFLENAPIIPISAITGKGIPELRDEIKKIAATVRGRKDKGVFRLPIDRVFTIKGFGTVVAGTIVSGSVKVDDSVELLPQGQVYRVRGIQVHEKSVSSSAAGLRTAINLQGAEKEFIERGNVLGAPGYFSPAYMVDAQFSYLDTAASELQNRARVHIHIGTSEIVARIILLNSKTLKPGEEAPVQIHFEAPVIADMGDRFVVRNYSPVYTIGGGVILDARPMKHKRFEEPVIERLQNLLTHDPVQQALESLKNFSQTFVTISDLAKAARIPASECEAILMELVKQGEAIRFGNDTWHSTANLNFLKERFIELLKKFHKDNPLRVGMPIEELRSRLKPSVDKSLFDAARQLLQDDGTISMRTDKIAMADHIVNLSPEQIKLKEKLETAYANARLTPPSSQEILASMGKGSDKILSVLIEMGELVRLEENMCFHSSAIEEARKKVVEFLESKKESTLSELRQHLGISRKYALPILVYFDSLGITERDGDIRKLKKGKTKKPV